MKENKAINFTGRDKEILKAVWEYGLISTEQLRHLHFSSMSRARKRLLLLTRHGLLLRISRPIQMGEGTKSKLYCITTKGIRMLNVSAKVSTHRPKVLSPQFAEHQLGINRFRICLELAMRNKTYVTFSRWLSDRHNRVGIVIPDATFDLNTENKVLSYYLELDRGTTPLARIKSKLIDYIDLFLNPKRIESQPSRGFRVLIVTNSESRTSRILEVLRDLPAKCRRTDIFLITESSKYGYERSGALFQPIWKSVMGDRIVAPAVSLIPSFRLPTVSGNPPVYRPFPKAS